MKKLSPSDLRELVYRGVESEVLDYKSPLCWTEMSRTARAKIVRHCLALANTKGGCVVIGVGEDRAGHPSEYLGLTEAQAHSFDPTVVGAFVNHYVDPPIDFTIERPTIDGRRYAIIVVNPFCGLPHVCSCAIEGELQAGAFYIRTPDASSRVACRAVELHEIVRRALRNQREELGRMLRGILYESQTTSYSQADFAPFAEQSRTFFAHHLKNQREEPFFTLELCVKPPDFQPDRFALSALREAAERAWNSWNTGNVFITSPEIEDAYFTNVSLRGVAPESQKMWQFFQSGLFLFLCRVCRSGRTIRGSQTGIFLRFAMAFLGAYFTELGMAEELLTIELTAENVENWALTAGDGSCGICRIPAIRLTLTRSAADLAAGWEEHAQTIFLQFAERFNFTAEQLKNLPRLLKKHETEW